MKRETLAFPQGAYDTGGGWLWSAVGHVLQKDVYDRHIHTDTLLATKLGAPLNFCAEVERAVRQAIVEDANEA